jgi:hypothetical protein
MAKSISLITTHGATRGLRQPRRQPKMTKKVSRRKLDLADLSQPSYFIKELRAKQTKSAREKIVT